MSGGIVGDNLNQMDANACVRAIGEGDATPAALVESCLERIGERDAEIGAWHFLDHATIQMQLEYLDTVEREARGPLHGVPVGVKDIYDTRDMPTGYGSQIYEGYRPPWDAAAVARLRGAGAIVLGKTVTTEFAYWKAGKTRNPHDTSRTPGGSSSGSAAAVADYMVPLAIGSQTVASTIRPASFCGIVGFKPTWGRISLAGVKPLAGSMDTAGVFARTVDDAALIAGVMAGRMDWAAATRKPSLPKLRLVRSDDWDQASAEAVSAVVSAAASCKAAGAQIEDVTVPEAFAKLSTVQNTILAVEASREFASEWLHDRDRLSEQISGLIEEGLAVSVETYAEAVAARNRAMAGIDKLFGSADVLIAPSTLGEAPPAEQGTGDPLMSRTWTMLGLPSISLPCGKGPDGMPLGLQIAARPDSDGTLLAIARWIEAQLS